MTYRILPAISAFILCTVLFLGVDTYAQEESIVQESGDSVSQSPDVVTMQQATDTSVPGTVAPEVAGDEQESKPYSLAQFPSLFFTYWQHEAIREAKNSRGFVKPPTQEELDAIGLEGEDNVTDHGVRELALGGIVYEGTNKWTIWLNETRITPNAIPKEVLDLQVFKDYIEVKWLDEATNQIFPIRLRAHERFNLDMRIFLPG